jgi:hypothetical protein
MQPIKEEENEDDEKSNNEVKKSDDPNQNKDESSSESELEWVCPPVNDIPLKYQKNKYYFQFRIDKLPNNINQPKIYIGICRKELN